MDAGLERRELELVSSECWGHREGSGATSARPARPRYAAGPGSSHRRLGIIRGSFLPSRSTNTGVYPCIPCRSSFSITVAEPMTKATCKLVHYFSPGHILRTRAGNSHVLCQNIMRMVSTGHIALSTIVFQAPARSEKLLLSSVYSIQPLSWSKVPVFHIPPQNNSQACHSNSPLLAPTSVTSRLL